MTCPRVDECLIEQEDYADLPISSPCTIQLAGRGINMLGTPVALCGTFNTPLSIGCTPRLAIEGMLTNKATDGTVCPFPEDHADDIGSSLIVGGSCAVRKLKTCRRFLNSDYGALLSTLSSRR